MSERTTVNRLRHEIQIALVELRESEAALEQGEHSKAHDVIRTTITRLEGLIQDAAQSRLRS